MNTADNYSQEKRYALYALIDESAQQTREYKYFERMIQGQGSMKVNSGSDIIHVYSVGLAYIFSLENIPAIEQFTEEKITIRSHEYLNTYIEAYRSGRMDFDKDFALTPDIIYGKNAELYVRDIHKNYFHTQIGNHNGWQYVKKWFPFLLTHKVVREFGYYSGFVSQVEELVSKYPNLFKEFDKCDITSEDIADIDTSKEDAPSTQDEIKEAFSFMLGNDPRRHVKILSQADFDKLVEWVAYFFDNGFTTPNIDNPIKSIKTNKGNVVWAFLSFFKDKHPEKTYPKSLFELIKKCFYGYRNDKLENLKKTTRPQHFDELYGKIV